MNQLMDCLRAQPAGWSLDTAAKWTGYSQFHFHRLFKAHAGETLQEFSSRTRLARAARLLRGGGGQNILRVGLECGFASAEDFSRRFRRFYGVSPREAARQRHVSLNRPAPRPKSEVPWPVSVESFPALDIVYTRVFGAIQNQTAVRQALRRLYDWSAGPLIGLSWDDFDGTPLDKFTYDAGVAILPPGPSRLEGWLNRLRLPAQLYAVMDFRGDLADEEAAFAYLHHTWMPRHNCRPAPGPGLEVMLDERSLTDWNRLRLKLCVPIRSDRA